MRHDFLVVFASATGRRWFMARMGFTGTKDGKVAQARWAAVRHGHSGEKGDGQDHIHLSCPARAGWSGGQPAVIATLEPVAGGHRFRVW
ncbi:hypothetical protein [Nocardia niigatensis]